MSGLHKMVTPHAVIRWLERVEGMDMAAVRREAGIVTGRIPESDVELLAYMRKHHRLDVGATRRKIAPEPVVEMIRMGASSIHVLNRRFRLQIVNGYVLTVSPLDRREG